MRCIFQFATVMADMPLPWFEFQNICDQPHIRTADDLMETLLSSALKMWRMIYNETQPLSCFRGGCGRLHRTWGTSGDILCSDIFDIYTSK